MKSTKEKTNHDADEKCNCPWKKKKIKWKQINEETYIEFKISWLWHKHNTHFDWMKYEKEK